MMSQHAVTPIEERIVLQGVFVTERRVVERVPARRIEAAEIHQTEALLPERPLDFCTAIERSDAGRIENEIGVRDIDARRRALAGGSIDEDGALREKRPIFDELTAEFLRRDRDLIDFDVRKIRVERTDQVDRRRQGEARVDTVVPNVLRQKRLIGLLKLVVVSSDAFQAVDVRARPGARRRSRNHDARAGRPKARVGEGRPRLIRLLILHQSVECPDVMLASRSNPANELKAPRMRAAGGNVQDVERDDHDGVPAVGRSYRSGAPVWMITRVFIGLIVSRTQRRRLEIVRLRSRAARVDADTDKVVDAEAEVVDGLRGDDRNAALLDSKSDVERLVI